jgi:hypothetical protein
MSVYIPLKTSCCCCCGKWKPLLLLLPARLTATSAVLVLEPLLLLLLAVVVLVVLLLPFVSSSGGGGALLVIRLPLLSTVLVSMPLAFKYAIALVLSARARLSPTYSVHRTHACCGIMLCNAVHTIIQFESTSSMHYTSHSRVKNKVVHHYTYRHRTQLQHVHNSSSCNMCTTAAAATPALLRRRAASLVRAHTDSTLCVT